MQNDPKEWCDVDGFNGRYEMRMIDIEPYVEIRGKTKFKKTLTPYIDGGYYKVGLYLEPKGKPRKRKLHRLVAEKYIPNPFNKSTVNHKNGIKTDNRIENLEWMSISENLEHARKNDLIHYFKKGSSHQMYLGDISVYRDGVLVDVLKGQKDIEEKGFSNTVVYKIVNTGKEYKGCIFKR